MNSALENVLLDLKNRLQYLIDDNVWHEKKIAENTKLITQVKDAIETINNINEEKNNG